MSIKHEENDRAVALDKACFLLFEGIQGGGKHKGKSAVEILGSPDDLKGVCSRRTADAPHRPHPQEQFTSARSLPYARLWYVYQGAIAPDRIIEIAEVRQHSTDVGADRVRQGR